jgi:NADPH:quinone reductase
MKAIAITSWGGPEVLELVDRPQPVPAEGEVVIRVSVAGLNFADVSTRLGRLGAGSPPVIPGLEVAGEVASVGPGVTAPSVGDRVAAFVSSGYAEFAVAKAELTWVLPDGVSFEEGAAFPTIGVTAFNLLTKAARLQPGETVMIWGAAGGVGTMAAQLARMFGAGQVIGVVGARDKAGTADRAGCDDVVVYSEGDLTARILELTHDHGADVILNAVAGEELERDADRLADFGRLAVYGMASGRPGLIPSNSLHSRSCSLVGYSTSIHRKSRPHEVNAAGRAVLTLLEAKRIEIFRGGDFDLEDAADAHRHIESRQSVGKILLHVANSTS